MPLHLMIAAGAAQALPQAASAAQAQLCISVPAALAPVTHAIGKRAAYSSSDSNRPSHVRRCTAVARRERRSSLNTSGSPSCHRSALPLLPSSPLSASDSLPLSSPPLASPPLASPSLASPYAAHLPQHPQQALCSGAPNHRELFASKTPLHFDFARILQSNYFPNSRSFRCNPVRPSPFPQNTGLTNRLHSVSDLQAAAKRLPTS